MEQFISIIYYCHGYSSIARNLLFKIEGFNTAMTLTKPPVKHRPQLPKPADTSAALRAISIMETVVAADAPLSLTAIMAAVELPKPTVHRMIVLLEHAGLLMREPLGKKLQRGSSACPPGPRSDAQFERESDAPHHSPAPRHRSW